MVEPQVALPHEARAERGIALIVALLVMVIMTLLGVPFLLLGETENRIAENERLSQQALYAADAGAKMVVRWFDRPMHGSNVINPTLAVIDRTQRLINADGDPGTAPVLADGTAAKPYYKGGVDEDADGDDDVFDKPYRDHPGESPVNSLMGTEGGPDVVIDEAAGADAEAFLTSLSSGLLAGYPASTSGLKARISRIDVYEPPWVNQGGTWQRFGVGTVKVVAKIFKEHSDGTEEVLATRMVRTVVNEIPYYQGDLGPLHSCESIEWDGDFAVHWGIATAKSTATLHSNHAKLAVSLPRVPSPAPRIDLLWGYNSDVAWNAYYKDILEEDGHEIEDPWLRFATAGDLAEPGGSPAGAQPWPFTWTVGDALDNYEITFHPGGGMTPPGVDSSWDGTHSNVLQQTSYPCPAFPYETWKDIALTGGLNVHYYVWDEDLGDDYFRENGVGTSQKFRDITDDRSGLFFFDTTDRLAPHDDDGDGVPDNLTPSIKLSGGTWSVRGMVYLNAYEFETTGIGGRDATIQAPREPYQDKDGDGRFDPGEELWVNLDYPTQWHESGSKAKIYAIEENGANDTYENRGPAFTEEVNVWGIFYTNGFYNARGNGTYYGTMVSNEGIGTTGPTSGTADHYWDQSIEENWPPDDWGLPRVHVTFWETDL
jgi:hypothetical protein